MINQRLRHLFGDDGSLPVDEVLSAAEDGCSAVNDVRRINQFSCVDQQNLEQLVSTWEKRF